MTLSFARAAGLFAGFLLLDAATTALGIGRVGNAAELNPLVGNVLALGLAGLLALKGLEVVAVVGINSRFGAAGARNLRILAAVMAVAVGLNTATLAGIWR